MSGGAFCDQGKISLSHSASLAPTTQEHAKWKLMDRHGSSLARPAELARSSFGIANSR